ncbi:DUF1842 domain-containing protein [Flaviaesturariibacter aridisoli]|uniref:DUF1842 domain-containing protein n=1 Tax=Flaviaesturariibacter aridisoli TaxID=2545761 RepID=A0A4R4E6M4_9BACT|nr:DUF1842 domain-containing protein [Flaviaesturariibacter aridisoli]TCZ73681.1 DUF1842 domain-containing protein [Flaviaesturariibacter aridisoli]
MKSNNVGLFPVSYLIGGGLMGGVQLHLQLLVNTPSRQVNGRAEVTQSTNPPLDIVSSAHGDFTYMTVMPNKTSILVVLTGSAPVPPTEPITLQNLHVRMVLSEDWKTGTAAYSYKDAKGQWHEVTDAPVEMVGAATTA